MITKPSDGRIIAGCPQITQIDADNSSHSRSPQITQMDTDDIARRFSLPIPIPIPIPFPFPIPFPMIDRYCAR